MYWENINRDNWENNNIDIKTLDKINQQDTKRPIVYFDMDGVLANWNHKKSKEHPDGVTMEEIFSKGYFRKLKPIESYTSLLAALIKNGIDVRILSKSCYSAINEKWGWLQEHLPFIEKDKVYFVPLEGNKSDYVPTIHNYHILIDDYNENLYGWKGTAIKALTDKNTYNNDFNNINTLNTVSENLNMIVNVINEKYAKINLTEDIIDR